MDGGYAQHKAIDVAAALDVAFLAPVPKPRGDAAQDAHRPRKGDSEAVAAWRERMGTQEAKEIYKQRAATAETSGAATLFALTYNVLRLISLGG